MRDPIKVINHRATKAPVIREFLDAIDEYSLEDIDELDIKGSDKKLLRTHFNRLLNHHKEGTLNEWLTDAIKNMPINDEIDTYRVYIYKGPETTYEGYEVRSGDVVTMHDDWIRFDYYRIKIKSSIEPILNYCKYIDKMNVTDANKLISDMLNHRHDGSAAAGDQYAAQPFRISRM